MKKKILTIISLTLILALMIYSNGLGLFDKKTAYAVGDLNVLWGVPDGDPIFVVSNMLPGDTEDRDVDVANGRTVSRDVGVRGVKTQEIASFAAILDFVISEGGSDLYGGTSPTGPKTLQEFFDESAGPNGIFLSNLGNGDTTTYNFKATFPPGSGDDFIVGGTGNDELRGETGNDIIFGNEGDDKVYGAVGQDLLFGGSGNDLVKGENGEDIMFGNEGNDTMLGGNANDVMHGNEGNDQMNGENGTDEVFGDEDNDTLIGGNGPDTLLGNDGSDSANGQNGADTCDAEVETNCEL